MLSDALPLLAVLVVSIMIKAGPLFQSLQEKTDALNLATTPITDYANVALNFDFATDPGEPPIFETHDKTVTLGD